MIYYKVIYILVLIFILISHCGQKIIKNKATIGKNFPLIILKDQFGGLTSSGKFSKGKWILIGNNYENGYKESLKWEKGISKTSKSWKINRLWSLEFLPFYKPGFYIIWNMNRENPDIPPLTLYIDKNGQIFHQLGMDNRVDNLYFIENGVIIHKFSAVYNAKNFQKIKELLAK